MTRTLRADRNPFYVQTYKHGTRLQVLLSPSDARALLAEDPAAWARFTEALAEGCDSADVDRAGIGAAAAVIGERGQPGACSHDLGEYRGRCRGCGAALASIGASA